MSEPVRITFFGGVSEIGKNMSLFDCGGKILIVDAGAMFPDNDMYGVDLVIPDYTWLEANQDRIVGLVLSHGHEDHTGGLPFLLRKVRVPAIYGTRFTLGLVEAKLAEHPQLETPPLLEVHPGDVLELDPFGVECIHVTHSIPGSLAFGIRTPVGNILHTCDFKMDPTPLEETPLDAAAFARYGEEGVRLLICDVTNVEQPGHVRSQQVVGDALRRIIRQAPARVIVTTFASNIHRIQQVINVSGEERRKVVIEGRSMVKTVEVAERLGYLRWGAAQRIDIDEMGLYPPEEITVLTTGSQGEPTSVLARMAANEHRKLHVCAGDTVVHSATPIPGNEDMIWRTVNNLFRLGANVIYRAIDEVHVSGHCYQEELKLVLSLVKPDHVVPYHGEARHQSYYHRVAGGMGYSGDRIHTLEPYDVLEVTRDHVRIVERLDGDAIMVDGTLMEDVGAPVLRERRILAESGVVMVSAVVEADLRTILDGPAVETRGFIHVDETWELIEEALDLVTQTIHQAPVERDIYDLERDVKGALSRLFRGRLGRRPMIVPVIFEVEGGNPVAHEGSHHGDGSDDDDLTE